MLRLLFALLIMIAFNGSGYAEDAVSQPITVPPAFHSTTLPLPRFVSLQASKVYVRTGPGTRYPIKWIYEKAGLPVEILLEYEVWRKIRDHEGQTGWVHQSLLSGRRKGIIKTRDIVDIYRKPQPNSSISARIETGALVDVEKCGGSWCKIDAGGYGGWVNRSSLWGVYPEENFD